MALARSTWWPPHQRWQTGKTIPYLVIVTHITSILALILLYSWVRALHRILGAAKNIEVQKEYEQHLKEQFAAADANRNGTLSLQEFAALLRQLNINLSEKGIAQIFDEVNTDPTTDDDGQQVGSKITR